MAAILNTTVTSKLESSQKIDTKFLAKLLGISEITIRQSRVTGSLLGKPAPKFLKFGRIVRYDLEEVRKWIQQFERQEG